MRKYKGKKICIICEGYEELDYIETLKSKAIFSNKYDFITVNAKSINKWYYNNSLNKQNSLNNKENRSTEIEKATVKICSKSEEISNVFKKVKDKGILTEPLKYDTEKRTFVSEFPEKEKEFADFVKEYREAIK